MIFSADSYKEALKDRLLERKKVLSKFNFQSLARHCKVQKTYVSRVFNADAHFNEDQVFSACVFLGMTDVEKDYVMHLHGHERSHTSDRRVYHQKQLSKIRQMANQPSSVLVSDTVNSSQLELAEYYYDPRMLLVHTFLSITEYSESIKKIAEKLKMNESELSRILSRLERMGIIEVKDERFQISKKSLNLPSDSPLRSVFRRAMRYKLLDRIADERTAGGTNYSVVFSANSDSVQKISEAFNDFLKKTQEIVKSSPSEGVYQLNFDLECWS
jgi:predicted transcriptional regulator